MILRSSLERRLREAIRKSPVVALLGPRQSGKTTLARSLSGQKRTEYFDLEDPADLARLAAPQVALEDVRGLVVLDEVQRKPELFELLRVLADRPTTPARFLLLGSASPHLVRGVSESLAGRVRFIEIGGFDLTEVGTKEFRSLWRRGGFPRSFLAPSERESVAWRDDFTRTFLERDLPQLGITIPAATLRRFWTMLAHFHGQIWNAAEFARSLGTSEPTSRRYLDLLAGAYVVRILPPWFENLGKRQIRAPKVYIRDSGLLHSLLSLGTQREILRHPKCGASWEGFVIEQILGLLQPREAYFWGTHGGAELDLLILRSGRRLGFEVKWTDGPRPTRSMHVALSDLGLDRIYVVYPGRRSYRMEKGMEAIALQDLPSAIG